MWQKAVSISQSVKVFQAPLCKLDGLIEVAYWMFWPKIFLSFNLILSESINPLEDVFMPHMYSHYSWRNIDLYRENIIVVLHHNTEMYIPFEEYV